MLKTCYNIKIITISLHYNMQIEKQAQKDLLTILKGVIKENLIKGLFIIKLWPGLRKSNRARISGKVLPSCLKEKEAVTKTRGAVWEAIWVGGS